MTKETCLNKQEKLIQLFAFCKSSEDIYKKIIYYGQCLPNFPYENKTPDNLVKGCQSQTYLFGQLNQHHLIKFSACSEALISSGIAYLFIEAYSEEDPETILTCPPFFFEKLHLPSLLSISRSNGALSFHLKMKQIAANFLVQQKTC